ncbi:MAG: O-antigen ligase family protein [Chitinophagaceae bacterium]|nr:O-antigen ligase family protein [Chitinophagaceae bacterium]
MKRKALFIAVFFNYIGYFIYILLMFYIGLSTYSTGFSIILRFIIIGGLIIFFNKSIKLKANTASYLLLFFSVFYISRIIIDNLRDLPYYIGTSRLLLYYLSFDMIPFLLVANVKFDLSDFSTIRKSLLFSGLLFSVLSLLLFRSYVGTVGRLTTQTADSEMISPLALSYCSSLAIGIALGYWLENKTTPINKLYLMLIIVLAATPFFLGSSRGSLIALIFPFLLMMVLTKKLKSNLRLITIILVGLIGIIYFSEYFGSSLIDRFTQTGSDIQKGNEEAVRTVMWRNAFDQFTANPIMGDRLKVEGFDIYPHNVFIEILQSTGLLGFIPFFILTIITFVKSLGIFRYKPAFSWISILFLQCLVQNLFSGGIFSASWLLLSMALVIAFDRMEQPVIPVGAPNSTTPYYKKNLIR